MKTKILLLLKRVLKAWARWRIKEAFGFEDPKSPHHSADTDRDEI